MADHLTTESSMASSVATAVDSNSWLIAVTAGRWQLATIQRAQALGIKIIAIDSCASAEGLVIADVAIVAELTDFASIIEQINSSAISDSVKGVLSICSDAGMLLAGQLREHYGISSGPNIEISQRLINKAHQRQCWQMAKVNGPEWFSASDENVLFDKAQKTRLPFMIKPVDSAGSRGVVKVEGYDEPISTYIRNALNLSVSKQVIIESFMAGEELTVEAFVADGEVTILAITEKDKIKATQGLVAYRLATTQLSDTQQHAIKVLVTEAVKALHYRDGPCHAEVIVMNDSSVGMVELAGRGGGFLVFEQFVQLASGFDIVSNTVKQAVGMAIENNALQAQECILHFFPNEAGILKSISGFAQANQIKGIEAGAFVTPGITMKNANCDGDRMGYVISYAGQRAEAEQQLKQAIAAIHFDIDA